MKGLSRVIEKAEETVASREEETYEDLLSKYFSDTHTTRKSRPRSDSTRQPKACTAQLAGTGVGVGQAANGSRRTHSSADHDPGPGATCGDHSSQSRHSSKMSAQDQAATKKV